MQKNWSLLRGSKIFENTTKALFLMMHVGGATKAIEAQCVFNMLFTYAVFFVLGLTQTTDDVMGMA